MNEKHHLFQLCFHSVTSSGKLTLDAIMSCNNEVCVCVWGGGGVGLVQPNSAVN